MKQFKKVIPVLLLALSGAAMATNYPNQPIHLVVPYAAGGGTDTAARLLAQHLTPILGTNIVVENKAGGATQIGTSYVVRAKPDGYTLLMGTANLATNTVLYDSLPYDVKTDLEPVAQVTDVPVYLFSNASGSITDLPALFKALEDDGQLPYATAGVGSIPHLAGELFSRQANIDLSHVPYKGSSEAVTGLASNQVPIAFDNFAPPAGQVRAGRVIPIAIAAKERSVTLPDVPTFTELGHPLEAASWWGVLAPAGTSADIREKLNSAINTVLKNPEVRDFFIQQGMHPVGGSAAQFAEHIEAETQKWRAIVDEANIRIGD